MTVHENKRKRDDNIHPSKKKQRFSSAVNDCPKDNSAAVTSVADVNEGQHEEEKPNKRSRLYLKRRRKQRKVNCQKVDSDAPCTNGKASTGNEADERNLRISLSESLTDFAKQVNFCKMICSIRLMLRMHEFHTQTFDFMMFW